MASFLITIDTEGDDAWSMSRTVTTENSRFLPRFQNLCERHGIKPTYLTDYEMAVCPNFISFARDGLARDALEIGMHLHAWNSPPMVEVEGIDPAAPSYLIEYPADVMLQKIRYQTELLQDTFGIAVRSHRSGRWALDERYARMLFEAGYSVDCSVTPYVSWEFTPGALRGGTDFSRFPDHHYFMDLSDISKPGDSGLLELPVSIRDLCPAGLRAIVRRRPRAVFARALRKLWPIWWLRPNGNNIRQMKHIVDSAAVEGRPYVEFMLHSSELMPGGSPTFRTAESIEKLYADLEELFSFVAGKFSGATLSEFRDAFDADSRLL